MKRRRKIYAKVIGCVAVAYIILVVILYLTEREVPTSHIQSLGDAFWYSIVTITTVGYGDMVPKTALGHLVGGVFLVLSMGILAALFGTVVSFLAGEAVPLFILGFQKEKNWYFFADYGSESVALAKDILKEDKDGIIIFGEKRDAQSDAPDYPCLFLTASIAKIVSKKKGKGEKCKIFLMKENDIGKNSRAVDVALLPVEVYARTINGRDTLSGNIHFFHSYDSCARQYWKNKPLCFDEQNVVIIGFGNYGQSILERAILTNILSDDQHVVYHIFGDGDEFLEMHFRLNQIFSIGEVSDTQDSLIFHKEFWGSHHKILEEADRIIICTDDEQGGWEIYWKLYGYYCVRGRVDLRSNRRAFGVSYFGSNDEIYTVKSVLKTNLNEAARTMNELFRKSVSYQTLSWEELDDFHRQSKIAAADHLLTKIRILLKDETITKLDGEIIAKAYMRYSQTKDREADRERYRKIDHIRWLRFYLYYNWKKGPVRDDLKREHPMLCPYAELTDEQKEERDHAWDLMNKISVEYGHYLKE